MANIVAKVNYNSTAADTFGSWTNVVEPDVDVSFNLLDFSDGSDTGWDITITNAPDNQGATGVNAVGTGDADWVDEAGISQTFHYVDAALDDNAVDSISNLNDSLTYNIRVFPSRNTAATDRKGDYSIDGFSSFQTVDAAGNSTAIAEFLNVSPVSGVIDVSWRVDSGDSFAYRNAIEVEEIEAGGPTTTPKSLAYSGVHTSSLSSVITFAQSANMTANHSSSIVKLIKKGLSFSHIANSSIVKKISKTLGYSAVHTVTQQEGLKIDQSASMNATHTANNSTLFIAASVVNKRIKGVILKGIAIISNLITGEQL